jgi:hypothetical protein
MDALKKKNEEKIQKLKALGFKITDKNFKIEEASLQEIRAAADNANYSENQLIEALGKEVYARKETEDATQKFTKSMDQAKEAFSRLVSGGVLDKLASGLQGLVESSLFKGFVEKGEAQASLLAAEKEKDLVKQNLAQKALDSKAEATGVEDITDVAGAAAAGAAVGAGIGALFAGVGAGPGALIGGLVGGAAAAIQNAFQEEDANVDMAALKEYEKGAETLNDFILRPGQPPLKFNKGDILMGGTNLEGGGNVEAMLGRILAAIENGGNVYMDGNKVGKSLALSTSRMG